VLGGEGKASSISASSAVELLVCGRPIGGNFGQPAFVVELPATLDAEFGFILKVGIHLKVKI
jgi:hypothetical protein